MSSSAGDPIDTSTANGDPIDPIIQQAHGYEYWAADEDPSPDYSALIAGEQDPTNVTGKYRVSIRKVLRFLFISALILGVAFVGYNFYDVYTQTSKRDVATGDAIIVLGAAQFNGEPSPVFAARLDHALLVYKERSSRPIVTTGAKQEGDTYTEGFSGYTYLRDRGVAEKDLVIVTDGSDTYQQLSASALQLEQRDIGSAVLVSDSYHTARLRLIAQELGMKVSVSPRYDEPTWKNYLRETAAVTLGRLVGFRRISAWDLPG